MSATPSSEQNAQTRSQKKLQEIQAMTQILDLHDVLDSLPSFKETAFTVKNGVAVLNIGPVVTGPYVNDCKLHCARVPYSHPSYHNENASPLHSWIDNLERETPGERSRKGAFAWHKSLYEGLFGKKMVPASAALVHYCFIRWAASTPGSVEVYQDVSWDALFEALRLLKGTEEFRNRAPEEEMHRVAVVPSTFRPMQVSQANGSEEFRDRAPKQEMHLIAVAPSGINSMEPDQANNTEGNRVSVRQVLDDIKELVPAVTALPALEEMGLRFEEHGRKELGYLPLRLYIGTSTSNAPHESREVWMYMRYPEGRRQRVQQPCEVGTANADGNIIRTKTLSTGESKDLNGIQLAAALSPSKNSAGSNYLPLTSLTQYCFLLQYKKLGLEPLYNNTIVYDTTFLKYLMNGVIYYCRKTTTQDLPPRLLTYKTRKDPKPNKTPKYLPSTGSALRPTPQQSLPPEQNAHTNANSPAPSKPHASYTPASLPTSLRPNPNTNPPTARTPTIGHPPPPPPQSLIPGHTHTLSSTALLQLKANLESQLVQSLATVGAAHRNWWDALEAARQNPELSAVHGRVYASHPSLWVREDALREALDGQVGAVEGIEEVVDALGEKRRGAETGE